jgi:hypothetical protein
LTDLDAKLDALHAQFPSLASSDHSITSRPTDEYNCVAWVNRETGHWFEPGIYWPVGVSEPDGDEDLDCYVELFEKWGYEVCATSSLEAGYLKIAIYADGQLFQHVARQLRDGRWSSKAGKLHDLWHRDLYALHPSGVMRDARPTVFMRKPDNGGDMQMEESGLILLS